MDTKTNPLKLYPEPAAAEFLGLPEGALGWRERRDELALPSVWISDRGRRYRYGDLVLVATGKKPLLKKPGETPWVSPFVAEGA